MRRSGTRMHCLFNGLHRCVQWNLTSPASMRATAPAAHAFRREQLARYFSRFTSIIDRSDTSPPIAIRRPRTLSGRFIVTARCRANLCVRFTSESVWACKDAQCRTEPHVNAARRRALIRDRAVAWSAKRFSISAAKVRNANTRDT